MTEHVKPESIVLYSPERPTAPAHRALKVVAGWSAAWRAARARRRALVALLEMSQARLVDLGIERQDIHLAIENERFWRAFSRRPVSRWTSPAQKVSLEAADIRSQRVRDL
ncbi:hypothetical protein [Devosia nitrariae]|uniref:DUF1127 domain-containing protein n=1 Tax=Devosia nitrariae TaxID=2071872 RepID=A0ABQ5WEL2_9HYPH|nr:hypothetical protein [Devosia nitrariae]GLQ58148.1 hypothetical protein GCM10010862_54070 [Devosia nitrariae]